jgi:hypothetical protein
MNIFKLIMVALTATGLGFGVDEVIKSDIEEKAFINEQSSYEDFTPGYCHRNDEYFLEHMLDQLTVEEQVAVQSKIDELLIKYDISFDDLNYDFDEIHNFMLELMDFFNENGINYQYHGNHNDNNEEFEYGHHMGMHR